MNNAAGRLRISVFVCCGRQRALLALLIQVLVLSQTYCIWGNAFKIFSLGYNKEINFNSI